MKIKIGDIIIIIMIIIFAVVGLLLGSSRGANVVVEVDGDVIASFDLDEQVEYVYKGKYTNVITVKNGKAYVSESDCPDNTCVHSGSIEAANSVICCLPNKLVLRIENAKKGTDVISG